MKTHLALLRGVNVGGNKKVAMTDLRAFVETIGFTGAKTLLNSGNLVFQSNGQRDDAALESFLEEQAAKHLGLSTWLLVRSVDEWSDVITRNPLVEQATAMPSRFLVMFFRQPPASDVVQTLLATASGSERFHIDGKHLYASLPDGILDSKLTNLLMGARFSKLCTGRNWNTVLKLGALAGIP